MKTRENILFARELRKASTDAELKLWQAVRSRRLAGWKFRRQLPMGAYIADFVCLDARLIVEADGGQHAERQEYDASRTRYLQSHDYRVMRFWDQEILRDLDAVLEQILRALADRHPHPSPLPLAGEGTDETA